jgi:hypothetical protein
MMKGGATTAPSLVAQASSLPMMAELERKADRASAGKRAVPPSSRAKEKQLALVRNYSLFFEIKTL